MDFMLSHEINERIAPLFDSNENGISLSLKIQPATELIEILYVRFNEVMNAMSGVADGYSVSDSGNNVHRIVANTPSLLSKTSVRKFFEAYEGLLYAIDLASELEIKKGSLREMKSDLIGFGDCYDQFLVNQSPQLAWTLIRKGYFVHIRLKTVFGALLAVYERLENSTPQSEISDVDQSHFSLSMPFCDNYTGFVLRLVAIKKLYSEICQLLNLSEQDTPLKIFKVESGSLWVKLFGESRAVALLTRFIEESAGFIYRAYTSEGKVSAIPRKIESLDRVIGLRASLIEAGIDISEMDDQIKKSSLVISKELTVLLERQSSVKINGRITSVSDEMLKREIELHPWPLLEHLELSEQKSSEIEKKSDNT
jgi:hypothetical protein